jgi:tetratricopeptide (TPR) repeat protein
MLTTVISLPENKNNIIFKNLIMKTKSLYLTVLIIGLLSWSCTKTNSLQTSPNPESLKTSLNNGVTELTSALNKISSSEGYQVLAGPADLTTKSAVLSPLDTITHSILLTDIAGVYDYKLSYLAKQYTESISYYEKAITLKPYAIEARFGCVKPLSALEDWEKVKHNYLEILTIDPQNTVANYWLGVIIYNRKDFNSAARLFEKHSQFVSVRLRFGDYDGLVETKGWQTV